MIKNAVIILISLGICFNSCKKNPNNNNSNSAQLRVEKSDVKSFEIISVILNENLSDKYTGQFGGKQIELLKTSDTTISFMVPDVISGKYTLKTVFGNFTFNVTEAKQIITSQVLNSITVDFETKMNLFVPISIEGKANKDSLIQFKNETIKLINSMSDKDKEVALKIYEANKQPVLDCYVAINSLINSSTVLKRGGSQSNCPNSDYKSFYDCTAQNLGQAATQIKPIAAKFLEMLTMAGAVAITGSKLSALGPAAVGLTAIGISLPVAAATYLLVFDLAPAIGKLWDASKPFLSATWILGSEIFNNANTTFVDQLSTSLNLSPKFKSLTNSTINITAGTKYYNDAINGLNYYLNKMKALFQPHPDYTNSIENTTLNTNEIVVENISNSNVVFQGNDGEKLKFKSRSGKEEYFNYKLTVNKEGFTYSKTLNGLVKPPIDSTDFYTQLCVGNWIVQNIESKDAYYLELTNDGYGTYTGQVGGTKWDRTYGMIWEVVKVGNKYYFTAEDGFWHPAYTQYHTISGDKPKQNLTIPLVEFIWYTSFNGGTPSLLYKKQ